MGKKKKFSNVPEPPPINRPFCFFCDRTFDDETVLLQHQRSKHFRCHECDASALRGKCESVQGLMIHTLKVHSKTLTKVPNALLGRDNPQLNVYGMEGIPPELLEERGFQQHMLVGSAQPPAPQPAPAPPPPAFVGVHGLPGMPPLLDYSVLGAPPAPSLEGFQQFLAAQKLAQPLGTLPMSPLGASFAGTQVAPSVPLHLDANPSSAGTLPSVRPMKRPLEEPGVIGEDISVEEKRALLVKYQSPA
mmetsp:Transcript_108290/g.345835  ORF Transcript_108290/g.345835 Transcript_108290/m.345835 type:complete len:247 (+) Transcript_108290:76-816(+)